METCPFVFLIQRPESRRSLSFWLLKLQREGERELREEVDHLIRKENCPKEIGESKKISANIYRGYIVINERNELKKRENRGVNNMDMS